MQKNTLTIADSDMLKRRLADAVGEIHCKNIVHGDMHTGNVMVNKIDNDFKITIIDFGRANKTFSYSGHRHKHLATELTKTPGYHEPTKQSDVYALGMAFKEINKKTDYQGDQKKHYRDTNLCKMLYAEDSDKRPNSFDVSTLMEPTPLGDSSDDDDDLGNDAKNNNGQDQWSDSDDDDDAVEQIAPGSTAAIPPPPPSSPPMYKAPVQPTVQSPTSATANNTNNTNKRPIDEDPKRAPKPLFEINSVVQTNSTADTSKLYGRFFGNSHSTLTVPKKAEDHSDNTDDKPTYTNQ